MDVRAVLPEEHERAGAATAAAYREFAPADHGNWGDYLRRVADVGARARHAAVLAAVEDGEVLGTVTLEVDGRIPGGHPRDPLGPDEAHVRMLGVRPDARGRGVGRTLMEAAVEAARGAGKRRLTLNTTPDMAAARRLYEAMGFRRGPDKVWDDGFRLLSYELDL